MVLSLKSLLLGWLENTGREGKEEERWVVVAYVGRQMKRIKLKIKVHHEVEDDAQAGMVVLKRQLFVVLRLLMMTVSVVHQQETGQTQLPVRTLQMRLVMRV